MKWFFYFFALVFSLNLSAKHPDRTEFVFVIPSYNNEKWCIKNLESVVNQTYPHWSIIYINDCSTDKTGILVENFVRERGLQDKFRIVHNKARKGAMANYYAGIMKVDPEKVVATLDGDDRLAHNAVLELLSKIYENKNIWVTHGNYTTEPFTVPSFCTAYPENASFRKHLWMGCQLRTFYAKLFRMINKQDLEYNGTFVTMTSDIAFMMPILEMASLGHTYFVQDVLYIVNTANPLSDIKVDKELQLKLDKHIRSLTPYKPLKKLFFS